MALSPGSRLGGFEIIGVIGAGGMGVVYRATDVSLKREVAIKTLPRVTAEHAALLKREAQAMASMNHPNLAVIYGIESWRGTPFLVEEYLGGGTLADRLRKGPMAVGDALALGSELAAVVGDLHASGIVHCDIKPSNIGFSYSGIVKLVDFGIASMLRGTLNDMATTETIDDDDPSDVSTFGGRAAGTPAYMPPEALMGARPSPSLDLWALSVVVFEAIAGERPFAGRTRADVLTRARRGDRPDLLALRRDCPEVVARFFDRSLAPDTDRRPQTAADLRAQLQTLRASVA
jgi:serine/threonine-protein kinase